LLGGVDSVAPVNEQFESNPDCRPQFSLFYCIICFWKIISSEFIYIGQSYLTHVYILLFQFCFRCTSSIFFYFW